MALKTYGGEPQREDPRKKMRRAEANEELKKAMFHFRNVAGMTDATNPNERRLVEQVLTTLNNLNRSLTYSGT